VAASAEQNTHEAWVSGVISTTYVPCPRRTGFGKATVVGSGSAGRLTCVLTIGAVGSGLPVASSGTMLSVDAPSGLDAATV